MTNDEYDLQKSNSSCVPLGGRCTVVIQGRPVLLRKVLTEIRDGIEESIFEEIVDEHK